MGFDEDFAAGNVGASDVLDRLAARRGWIVGAATEAEDRASIDFRYAVLLPDHTAASLTGQVKYDDKSAETGNVFIETVSVERLDGRREQEGWFYTTTADLLVIACPFRGALLMPMKRLRGDEARLVRFPDRTTDPKLNGDRYVSRGWVVPVHWMRARDYVTFEAMPDLPRLERRVTK